MEIFKKKSGRDEGLRERGGGVGKNKVFFVVFGYVRSKVR